MNELEALEKVLRGRRSVRNYDPRPVSRETIERLIQDACLAPSAGNRQDWEFTIVSSVEIKKEMADAVRSAWDEILSSPQVEAVAESYRDYRSYFDWFNEAPVVISVAAKRLESFLAEMCGSAAPLVQGGIISAGMAAQNLMLAASAMGLGTCCLTGPLAAGNRLKEILQMGSRRELVCLITLGYPADQPGEVPRKQLQEVMRYLD